MNTYRVRFFAKCPANEIRIEYYLTIDSKSVLMVDGIIRAVEALGVEIETTRFV